MPKKDRQRKNVSAPLNTFRTFRNRVFHNESICWNLNRVEDIHREMIVVMGWMIHREMIVVMGWMNRDVPGWLQLIDRFDTVCANIRKNMGW